MMIRRWNQYVLCITHFIIIIGCIVFVSIDDGIRCCLAFTQQHVVLLHHPPPRFIVEVDDDVSLYGWDIRSNWIQSSSRSVVSQLQLKNDDESNGNYEMILQQLIEPFDRWRFLQKLLDDDINDASIILFILQTSVRQQLQILENDGSLNILETLLPSISSPSLSTTPSVMMNDVEGTELVKDSESMVVITTNTETAKLTTTTTTNKPKVQTRRQIMEYIIHDVTSEMIHNLLQLTPELIGDRELYFLQQIELLLPNPEIGDDDAAKGLWDTIIELHGRESVKINERCIPQSMGWKTRCLMTRLLIYYDFFIIGLKDNQPPN